MTAPSPKALADLLEKLGRGSHDEWCGVAAGEYATCVDSDCANAREAVAYLRQPDLVIARLTLALPTYSAPTTLPVTTHGAGCPAREPGRYCVCGVSMPEASAESSARCEHGWPPPGSHRDIADAKERLGVTMVCRECALARLARGEPR